MSQSMIFPCPHCGMSFELTAEYLAQYGGQMTTCTSCGRTYALPTAAALDAAPPAAPSAGPVPVLPYSSAPVGMAMPMYTGVWREGNILVAANGSSLPPCCVKCNAPVTGDMKRKTFYWHHPAIYIAILSPLIYIILALVLRKGGTINVGLCEKHKKSRLFGIWGGTSLALLSIVVFVLAGQNDMPLLVPVGIVLILGGLIWAVLAARMLTPTRIDERTLWLRGACSTLLDTLPNGPSYPTWGAPGYQPYGAYPPR